MTTKTCPGGREALSVSDNWKFCEPYIQMTIEEIGNKYHAYSDIPLDKFNGLERIIGYDLPLSEITEDNVYDMVFKKFNKLSEVVNPDKWLKQKS